MIVTTVKGQIRGIETEHAYVYKGVPYAKPPIGDLRWHAPVPMEGWNGIIDAVRFQNRCAQPGEQPGSFYHKEFFLNPEYVPPMSEDCLYLNIWAPKEFKENCPVAIWYHGGGYIGGHSSEIEFDGECYAKRGIILVTVTYRLGIFGFCCHEELKKRDGHSGNYGQLDQIAAIDWVRENISVFGGDPDNITIFGQSAGGMSVTNLCCSPLTKGKIHKAIIQSCNGYRGPVRDNFPYAKMEKLWGKFLKKKKLSFSQFYQLSTQELVQMGHSFTRYAAFWVRSGLPMTPVVDGYFLPVGPDEAVDKGLSHTIPYMTGATKNDMGAGKNGPKDYRKHKLLQCLAKWSELHSKRGVDCYVYHFRRDLPGDNSGAFHSSELWYIFGTLGRSWRPMEKHDFELSEKMIDAWAAFMRTGNPGWESYKQEGGYIHMFE